jgi:hypothetical protein
MITAAREEEHRARANGTAAEDKVRGRGHRLKCTIAHAAIEMRTLKFQRRLEERFQKRTAAGERADAGPCAGVVEDALAMP